MDRPPQSIPPPGLGEAPAAVRQAPRLMIRGLHHVTLIVANLEASTSFYRDLLGMALVESGVNPDDPTARHYAFGDAEGTPGTVLTCMEYPHMAPGEVGPGATHHIALRVGSREELDGWVAHLREHNVQCTDPLERGTYWSTYLRDPDGHIIELATEPGVA
jgi:catechol 2,3-dioxygenase-like lactoylglutathione lyase family enzyme